MSAILEKLHSSINREPIRKEVLLLRVLCFCVFFGRAWQHWFWDIPIRDLLWDEDLMKGIIQTLTGMTWQEYVTNLKIDTYIKVGLKIWACFYILCGIACLTVQKKHRWFGKLLWAGGISLFILALLYWKSKFYNIGQLIEYCLQFGSPIMLWYLIFKERNDAKIRFWISVAIALTFIGHGLYALGYYPRPGHFVQMCLRVFGMKEALAHQLLFAAGWLDVIAAFALFVPALRKPALWYCVVWGSLTALARVVSNFYIEIPLMCLHQHLHQTVFRLVHGGIPFLLLSFYALKKR